jgi:hypothetical protein
MYGNRGRSLDSDFSFGGASSRASRDDSHDSYVSVSELSSAPGAAPTTAGSTAHRSAHAHSYSLSHAAAAGSASAAASAAVDAVESDSIPLAQAPDSTLQSRLQSQRSRRRRRRRRASLLDDVAQRGHTVLGQAEGSSG